AGYDILRISLDGRDTVVLNETKLTADDSDFLDSSAENGVTYAYSLRLLLIGSDECPITNPDLATPGQAFGWLVAGDGSRVSYMTPDFRDEIYSLDGDFFLAEELQLSPGQKEVWVLDRAYDKISRFSVNGEQLEDATVFNNITAFAFNYQNGSLWLAVGGTEGALYHFDGNGILSESFRTGIQATSVAVDYPHDGAWVGSSQALVARVRNGRLSHLEHPDFIHPELVAAGKYSTNVWVLDTGAKTLFLFSDGQFRLSLDGFADPNDLAADNEGTTCWVADPPADLLYEIDEGGNITGTLGNLGQPWLLTGSPVGKAVYVTGRSGLISKVVLGPAVQWQVQHPDYPGRIALEVR
ncbi:MAG: hypothetical protein JXQ83_05695, partial [Candidatus Glassbacteria bacterium]|nr:hypothetical protein [Candidatus Glassbacteria bacterium]